MHEYSYNNSTSNRPAASTQLISQVYGSKNIAHRVTNPPWRATSQQARCSRQQTVAQTTARYSAPESPGVTMACLHLSLGNHGSPHIVHLLFLPLDELFQFPTTTVTSYPLLCQSWTAIDDKLKACIRARPEHDWRRRPWFRAFRQDLSEVFPVSGIGCIKHFNRPI